jgi:hypothetical protein
MTFCPDCGVEMHNCGQQAESVEQAEVRIAEINAKRDVEIARLSRSETAMAVEAAVEQTAIEAEAQVDSAVVEIGVLEELAEPAEPEPTPVTVISNENEGGEDAESAPVAEPPEAEPVSASRGASNPWWG